MLRLASINTEFSRRIPGTAADDALAHGQLAPASFSIAACIPATLIGGPEGAAIGAQIGQDIGIEVER